MFIFVSFNSIISSQRPYQSRKGFFNGQSKILQIIFNSEVLTYKFLKCSSSVFSYFKIPILNISKMVYQKILSHCFPGAFD